MDTIDLGLLLLRVLVAAILFAHATQKLFGWFSGSGPTASAALFDKLGLRPGRAMVIFAALSEIATAALLLLGLITPLATAVGVATMVVAGSTLSIMSGTFWNAAGGGEYPYVLSGVIAVLAFAGPGAFAVDAALDLPLADQPLLVGAASVVVGVAAALPLVVRARRAHAAGVAGGSPPS